jgi:hypothetical protein
MKTCRSLLVALVALAPTVAEAETTKHTPRKKAPTTAKPSPMTGAEAIVTTALGGGFLFFGLGALLAGSPTTQDPPAAPGPRSSPR